MLLISSPVQSENLGELCEFEWYHVFICPYLKIYLYILVLLFIYFLNFILFLNFTILY